jgi:hypothetical protein
VVVAADAAVALDEDLAGGVDLDLPDLGVGEQVGEGLGDKASRGVVPPDYRRSMTFRHFVYVDRDVVRDFLAQAEGGVFDQTTQVSTAARKRGIGGNVGIGPAGASASAGGDRSSSEERVVVQTAASEFERLVAALGDELELLENLGPENPPKRSQLIEVDVVLTPVGMGTLLDLVDRLPPSAIPSDPKAQEAIAGIQALAASGDGRLSFIAAPVDGSPYRFGLDLRRDCCTGSTDELAGAEVTLCGKVTSVLRSGQTRLIGNDLGGVVGKLPAAKQAEYAAMFSASGADAVGVASPELQFPGAVVMPIALFR